MSKRSLILTLALLVSAIFSTAALACGGSASGKHMGNVVSIDAGAGLFTIRDMESQHPITFRTSDQGVIKGLSKARGVITVEYEEDDQGNLRATGVMGI